ncbi:hypothetical protein Tco_0526013 [Tanacetum coccineum]
MSSTCDTENYNVSPLSDIYPGAQRPRKGHAKAQGVTSTPRNRPRWVKRKDIRSSTTKVESEPPNGSNADIPNQCESKQALNVSACTLLSTGTSFNPTEEGSLFGCEKGKISQNTGLQGMLVLRTKAVRIMINSGPRAPRYNMLFLISEKTESSQQGLEFLLRLYLKNITIQHTVKLRKINNDQAPNASFQEVEFINPFCTRVQEIVQTRHQCPDPEMYMFALTWKSFTLLSRMEFVDFQIIKKSLPSKKALYGLKQAPRAWTLVQTVCYCARYQARPTQKTSRSIFRADHGGALIHEKSTSGGIQFLGDKLVILFSIHNDDMEILQCLSKHLNDGRSNGGNGNLNPIQMLNLRRHTILKAQDLKTKDFRKSDLSL